ncbi:MAG: TonB-dependent receptor [Sphingobacteriia bacterium]|nr:TonB-dependent receptor [Sphingobacteriia bacterium]
MKRLWIAILCICITGLAKATENENAGGTITGKVNTSDNNAAAGVTVILHDHSKKKITITNEDGMFQFLHLTAGEYDIEVSLIGYERQHQNVTVENGKKINLSFQLKISEKKLEEIVVVSKEKKLAAGKLNIAEKDMPQTMGVVSSKVIADQQALRVGDIVKNVPGVSLVQSRFGVNETYGARGYTIGVTGSAGGGSVFKNGLPSNIAGMPEAATLESVEIIKGSTAFLYGSSSGGLIVNLITKKPKYSAGGEITMNVGSYQQYKPVIDIYGPLSKNLAYRVVATYENDHSYRDVVTTRRTYINPSLMYKFGNKSTLVVQGDYLNAQLTPDPGVGLLDSGRVLTNIIPRSRFQNVIWSYNNVKQSTSSAEFKHIFSDKLLFNAAASFQNTDVDSYGCGNLNTASPTGVIGRPLSKAHSIEKDYAVQVNLDGKFKTNKIAHHFLAGADFTSVVTFTDAFNVLNANGSVLKTYDTISLLDPSRYVQRTDMPSVFKTLITKAPSNRAGVYFQDLITLASQLKIFVGIRYTYQATVQTTIDSMATQTRPAVTANGTAPTTVYNVFSPKLGFIYQPSINTSLFASYANNFTTNTGVDVYGNALPASIINQYEVGVKHNALGGKVNLNVSVYRIINSNLAQQAQYKADGVTPNTDANVKTLSGETTSDGVEVGANATLSKNCYFIAGYAYNFIRFTHTSGAKGSNIEGEQLPNAPLNTANASFFYTFSNGVLNKLKLGATCFYTGFRYGGYNNTVGQSVLGSRLVPLADFATADISAAYTVKKVTVMCKLSNVFNALSYLVHDNYSITPIAPRQVMATATYRF